MSAREKQLQAELDELRNENINLKRRTRSMRSELDRIRHICQEQAVSEPGALKGFIAAHLVSDVARGALRHDDVLAGRRNGGGS